MLPARKVVAAAVAAVSLSTAMPSMAVIEEIVVTARKTEESLQQTPVAISAFNESMLINNQVAEIADLKRSAPNLSIMPGGTGSSALAFVAIRGAAQVSPGGAADSAVGTYVDGVYYARGTGGNLGVFDVGQVEVLRGPQGTLFGRNTTGGALNITTNNPTETFEGRVKVELGNYDLQTVEAVVNLPLISDELALRLGFRASEHSGYGDYVGYTDPLGFVYDGLNQEAAAVDEDRFGRIKLRWSPADSNFTATIGAHWSEYEDTGQRSEAKAINTAFAGGLIGQLLAAVQFDPDHFLAQQQYGQTYWNTDTSTINPTVFNDNGLNNPQSTLDTASLYLDVDAEFGDYQFKSITAWAKNKTRGTVDLDGLPVNLFTFDSKWDQHQYSQEFQLSGSVGDNIDWISGLYYFEERSSELSRSRFGGIFGSAFGATGVPLDLVGAPVNAGSDGLFENTSLGAFVQANIQLSDVWRATGGIRYTKDTRDRLLRPRAPEVGQAGSTCILTVAERDDPNVCKSTDSVDFEYPAWILSTDYQVTEDIFVYAKTSAASMAGGWNIRATRVPAFEPENVQDYEIGFKSDWLDGRLRFNTAFFYMMFEDQQRFVNEFDPLVNSTTQYVRNAGESVTSGVEIELTVLPWEGMTISSSLSVMDSKYDSYDVVEQITTGPNAGTSVVVDHSSEKAPQAPDMTFNLGATQILDTALGELELHADYYWVDDTWFSDTTVRPGESASLQAQLAEEKRWQAAPSYGLINARVALTTNDESWQFSVWGQNLSDEENYTGVGNFYTGFGTAMWFVGKPRTYGATAQFRW